MNFKTLTNNFISIFFPDCCVLCNRTLVDGEKHICLFCFKKIPLTNYHRIPVNATVQRFSGKIPCQKASSFLYYTKGGNAKKIIAEIKYKGNIKLGKWMGEWMAKEMQSSGFFNGIDLIVPVPLHKKKLRQRGYNQSEEIGKGISLITNLPLCGTYLKREKDNPSQTKRGVFERWLNTHDIFNVAEPESLIGKHVLLIDDVLTSGSTLEACAHPILNCENTKISILTLAIAQ